MRRATLATLAILAGFAMASCATPRDAYVEEGAARLTDNRLRDFMQGSTIAGTMVTGAPIVAFYGVGGDAYLKSGETTDKGTWRLSDDRSMVCATWEKLHNGEEACFAVLRKGDDVRIYDADGELIATGRFERGDVERLAG